MRGRGERCTSDVDIALGLLAPDSGRCGRGVRGEGRCGEDAGVLQMLTKLGLGMLRRGSDCEAKSCKCV